VEHVPDGLGEPASHLDAGDAGAPLATQAIEDHTRAGTPPWLARTRVDWAESLLRRGENERARELALAAVEDVGDLELTVTRNRAKAVLASTT
jgi:hypothetical protein